MFLERKIRIFEAKSRNYVVYNLNAFSYYDKFN